MDIRWIDGAGPTEGKVRLVAVPDLLAATTSGQGLVWVDVEADDPERESVLAGTLGLRDQAVADSGRRNPAPKLHLYPGHAFLVLHAPEIGQGGHIHYIELDVFVAERLLVTVHGPLNPQLDREVGLLETRAVADRIESGRWRPESVHDLLHAVVTGINRRMTHHVSTLTTDTWRLEKEVTSGVLGDAEAFLEEMFRVRHGLQAVRTMAALDHEVFGRMAVVSARPGGALVAHADDLTGIADVIDQFERVRTMAEAQSDYLQGVISLYQTRATTKMTVAAERLAVIAAVTLPVTAISSVMGMNVIASEHTNLHVLAALLAVMTAMSAWLLLWSRRQGWW